MSESTYCLQLDVGNSSAKWRLVCGEAVLARGNYRPDDKASQAVLFKCAEQLDHIWVASVAASAAEDELSALLEQRWGIAPWFARTEAQTGSLLNSYADPTRMGVDRWLAMLGAWEREAGRLCVIDAGSALTIDIVSATGQHEGGYIIPGPSLMERALLLDTDRVRFEEDVDFGLTPGESTAEAVRHGIALAQAGAVELALQQAGSEPMTLLFSGGAGEILRQLVQRSSLWAPDLVFEGLAAMAALRQAAASNS
ncbi:Type III pantothenate kinase [Halioglobus japonicus]|nr:Type III pantothenate kinase [Halioglobus japonicus]